MNRITLSTKKTPKTRTSNSLNHGSFQIEMSKKIPPRKGRSNVSKTWDIAEDEDTGSCSPKKARSIRQSIEAVANREKRKLHPKTNNKLLRVKDILDHMQKMPSITAEEFLKEDFISSPRFKENPVLEAHRNQVRFNEKNKKTTVARSHLGTSNDFAAYERLVKEEQDKKKKEMAGVYKRGKSLADRVLMMKSQAKKIAGSNTPLNQSTCPSPTLTHRNSTMMTDSPITKTFKISVNGVDEKGWG